MEDFKDVLIDVSRDRRNDADDTEFKARELGKVWETEARTRD